jgi:hypothetical protein
MNLTFPTSTHQAGLVRLGTQPTKLVGLVSIPESAITVTVRSVHTNAGLVLVAKEGSAPQRLRLDESVEIHYADLAQCTIHAESDGDAAVVTFVRPMGNSR